jgi:hypothetical protein
MPVARTQRDERDDALKVCLRRGVQNSYTIENIIKSPIRPVVLQTLAVLLLPMEE